MGRHNSHFINNIATIPDMFSNKLFRSHQQRADQKYQKRDSVVQLEN